MSTAARPACIIIEARRGCVRKARGLISRALRAAGVKITRSDYMTEAEARCYGLHDPRYTPEMTDAQMKRFVGIAVELAEAEGWDRAPFDAYHDRCGYDQ